MQSKGYIRCTAAAALLKVLELCVFSIRSCICRTDEELVTGVQGYPLLPLRPLATIQIGKLPIILAVDGTCCSIFRYFVWVVTILMLPSILLGDAALDHSITQLVVRGKKMQCSCLVS